VHQDVWTKKWTVNKGTKEVPDRVCYQFHDGNHFEVSAWPCQGQSSDGTPCNKKFMLQCKFCPWTKLPELKGGSFQTWSNPVACRDKGEVPRNANTHVNGAREGGKRGWHQFWYAVHSLYPKVAEWAAAGDEAAGGAAGGDGPPGDRQQMIEWFEDKVKDYRACKNDFEDAGLLVPGGKGAEYGIVKKFSMAEIVLGMMAPAKATKRQRPPDSVDVASKLVKTAVHSSDRAQAHVPAISPMQQALPLAAALAAGTRGGMAIMGAYNILEDTDPETERFLAMVFNMDTVCAEDGQSVVAAPPPVSVPASPVEDPTGGLGTSVEDPTGGFGLHAHHRPVFNVFLDAMTGVVFQTAQSRDEWKSYDVNQDFDRSHEFGLAQVIGAYLHRGAVSSHVLGPLGPALPGAPGPETFHQALRAPDPAGPLPYFQQLQAAALTPVVTASLGAIYCYWRIEHELLHTFYSTQLARWQGADIQGRLLQILGQWQQGVDPAVLQQELVDFFAQIDREIKLRLKECSDTLRYFCSNTGSFAQVVRAPRIWCFFMVLRLRHDADFSRALWDKGFRFVAAHLDPLGVAPRGRDEWITAATGLLSGTSPGGGAGQGGGGQAANPFDDSRDPARLVAQLLAAEGKEVDVAARAEEGEDVELPPVSERKSLTAARLHLVSQGLVCVCWGR
jgi:hypothetical protein